jgi:hypothetical protein
VAVVPPPDAFLPLVAAHADAVSLGWSDEQIERRLRDGTWQPLRHGWFTRNTHLGPDERWRAEVIAAANAHSRPLVLSHAHAARAHGWPRPLGGWGPLSFTTIVPPARRRRDTWIAVCPLEEDDVVLMGRAAVTSAARTVIDCARRLPPHDALAIADAALRRRAVTPPHLSIALAAAAGRPGVGQARRVLALADGRRETALESWSAWGLARAGVAPALWQATVLDHENVFLGRVDAWWSEGVAGEADGRAKYRLAAAERTGALDAEGLARVLDDERRRERELRRAGVPIVRWEARDALDPRRMTLVAVQLHRERLAASAAGAFLGRVMDL